MLGWRTTAVFICVFLTTTLSGCRLKREAGQRDRVILRAGRQVPRSMAGWTAVPPREPVIVRPVGAVDGKRIVYAWLATDEVVPESMDRWVAMPEKMFSAMAEIELPRLKKTEPTKHWEMRLYRRVPKEKDGWIGVPGLRPTITRARRNKDKAMAKLATGHLIPAEMDGWVAVPPDVLEKLVVAYQMRAFKTGKGKKRETGQKKDTPASPKRLSAPVAPPD